MTRRVVVDIAAKVRLQFPATLERGQAREVLTQISERIQTHANFDPDADHVWCTFADDGALEVRLFDTSAEASQFASRKLIDSLIEDRRR